MCSTPAQCAQLPITSVSAVLQDKAGVGPGSGDSGGSACWPRNTQKHQQQQQAVKQSVQKQPELADACSNMLSCCTVLHALRCQCRWAPPNLMVAGALAGSQAGASVLAKPPKQWEKRLAILGRQPTGAVPVLSLLHRLCPAARHLTCLLSRCSVKPVCMLSSVICMLSKTLCILSGVICMLPSTSTACLSQAGVLAQAHLARCRLYLAC